MAATIPVVQVLDLSKTVKSHLPTEIVFLI